MLEKLTSTDFKSLLNETFQVKLQSEEQFSADLIEVTEVGQEPNEENSIIRRAFSAIFHIKGDTFFPQQICSVEHETLGSLTLFLVPLGPAKDGTRYEAMFT
ncbi:MAG: hypothetical protein DWQ04_10840 [Chloroflexi bacterium]|nr:MAG: hypothetical protein DWQ04_10840 [Chloroflexota bacterium]